VVPSTWPDPLPTVVLEAMRAGCVVIASCHGGAVEMIEDERSGLLVPPQDVRAFAAAVSRAVDDADLRQAIGAAARERVATRFSLAAFRFAIRDLWAAQDQLL
jgi:glycosyltransferase involved in cell wall biosynthesis